MRRAPTTFHGADGAPLFRFTCATCGFSVIQAEEPLLCFCAVPA
jgi:hypothetical protein